MADIRPAAVAGVFYPSGPAELRRQISQCFAAAASQGAQRPPKVLISPHAGYVYSGRTAAHAYKLLAPWHERFTRVVIAGPAHRVPVRGLAAPTVGAFQTPLGRVPLDREALRGLDDLPQVVLDDRAHAAEHAIEVQLPFLQCVLGRFSLVPFAVGDASAREVAQVLDRLWGEDETLVVISSDLSHYLPYRIAQAHDRATVARIAALDPVGLDDACGAIPINGALEVARRRALAPRVLDLCNSGDTEGDREQVVGYTAIAFEERA